MAYASAASPPIVDPAIVREVCGIAGAVAQIVGFAAVMWLLLAGAGFL